jgi:hypothetical protein
VTLPLATSRPVKFSPVPVALGSSTSQKVRSIAANRAVLDAAAPLDAHKTADASVYVEQGLAPAIDAVSSSLATAASSTWSVPPVVSALPSEQPHAGLSATDSALLWMAEQWDAGTATKVAVGSLARKHQSSLTPEVATSVFSDADDWAVDATVI